MLSGAFITTASCLLSEVPKVHKRLADWAIAQISADTTEGTNTIRLLPSEKVSLQALCGILGDRHDAFLDVLGRSDDIDEFQVAIQNDSKFNGDVLNGIQSKSFGQLWDVLKKRQQQLYTVGLKAFVKCVASENNIVSLVSR